ncbi:MAG: hypothetical protein LBB85_07795 [Dysgonamonadaceae bacterium]|jgi:hypothetical protein|nr:hypothetical protein [Dysgonamonadaceae bacterium]
MASYEEKKNLAVGFVLPAPDPFASGSGNRQPSIAEMAPTGFTDLYEKTLSRQEQINAQATYQFSLARWSDKYESDCKSAKKNLAELNKMLLAGKTVKLEAFFTREPVAEWLNYIFLKESELGELVENMKAAPPECRTIVVAAIEKELKRMVNFRTLFEQMVNMLTDAG